jgi:hypothetical protein
MLGLDENCCKQQTHQPILASASLRSEKSFKALAIVSFAAKNVPPRPPVERHSA